MPKTPVTGSSSQRYPRCPLGRGAWRGQGIGETLLRAVEECARAEGIRALSLSVESDNYAVGLYERIGFRVIERSGGALTMLLRLRKD